jgi:hypothetical protein
MASNAQDQDAYVIPPRLGYVVAQSVDSTSRGYSMKSLVLQDENPSVALGQMSNFVWLDFEAIGNDIYFLFDSAIVGSQVIDDTALNAAGVAWTGFTATNSGANCPPGRIAAGTIRPVRVERQVDISLFLKCASGNTATLRITPSSQSMPGATRGS